MNARLAIVIPAYKGQFLAKALQSIAQQTRNDYKVYVGDDASPERLETIAAEALADRSYAYTRFDSNLGRRSLVKHWERCIALTNEDWIWLFSDDDLMDSTCVEAFYNQLALQEGTDDLYRFDSWMIDETDRIIALHSLHVNEESWLEFAYARLCGWRPSFMQQLIFPRAAYERTGGFVDLPLAWCADDAAIISMGQGRTIRHVPGARISWRKSNRNISPNASYAQRRAKLRAVCEYLKWLHGQLQRSNERLFPDDRRAFTDAMYTFLRQAILNEGPGAAFGNWQLLTSTAAQVCQASRAGLIRQTILAAVGSTMTGLSKFTHAVNVPGKHPDRR